MKKKFLSTLLALALGLSIASPAAIASGEASASTESGGFALFNEGQALEQAGDYAGAMEKYIQAAEVTPSNCKGLRNIGQWYEYGNDYIEQDYYKAAEFYAWAIRTDDASSCYYLGNLYEQGLLSQIGAPDYKSAAHYYQLGADKNNDSATGIAKGLYRLGFLYENGLGVTVDCNKAASFYERAVAAGETKLEEFYDEAVAALKRVSQTASEEPYAGAPVLTAESDILGLCDTGNKTTLKVDLVKSTGPGDTNLYHYDENGKRVVYEDQENICVPMKPVSYSGSAVLSFQSAVDDAKIDSSHAVVSLLDSGICYADEFILNATSLNGEWKNGQYIYTLSEGDIEFNTWGYDTTRDYNSGREWSIMGGDGAGTYFLRLLVSGIRYDGHEVAPVVFPVVVYCYGRTCTDLAINTKFNENTYDPGYVSGVEPSGEIQWKWFTEGEDSAADKPYMNDLYTDYFTVIWPQGADASGVTHEDVTVTLTDDYGNRYELSTLTAYGDTEFAVISGKAETTVAVTYQQWAGYPVFSHITITVRNGSETVEKTYDVASVVANPTQTGGGGLNADHALTCLNYHGLGGLTLGNAANTDYTLSLEKDGSTYFYAEDENGVGYLSEGAAVTNAWGHVDIYAPEDAWVGDGTDIFNLAVLGNVIFFETRVGEAETEVKTVNGEALTFTRNRGSNKSVADMISGGAWLEPGYNLTGSGAMQWAWTMRYQSGWTTQDKQPTDLPFVTYPYGYEPGGSDEVYTALYNGDVADGAYEPNDPSASASGEAS